MHRITQDYREEFRENMKGGTGTVRFEHIWKKNSNEEMYSNWRNKVEQAADNSDVYAAFVNMCCFNYMLSDISAQFNIGDYDIMDEYNPENLTDNVMIYDKYLEEYEKVCNKAGIKIKRFSDVDAFVADYLENQ